MRLYFLLILLFFMACGQPTAQSTDQVMSEETEPSYEQLLELHKQLLDNETGALDVELAGKIVSLSEQFANTHKGDPLSAEILFKGGDIARGMRAYGKAIQLWGMVWREYPESTQGPFSLFFQGFTFDNDLLDKDMARKYYNDFLAIYPEHELVDDVKVLMASLDKTPEQLLEEIRKQNN